MFLILKLSYLIFCWITFYIHISMYVYNFIQGLCLPNIQMTDLLLFLKCYLWGAYVSSFKTVLMHRCISASVHQCIGASATITWKLSKYGVFSGPYILVFGLNTGKCESKKNSVFGNFSRSKRRVSLKRVIVLIFRKVISLHFPDLLTKEITKIVC